MLNSSSHTALQRQRSPTEGAYGGWQQPALWLPPLPTAEWGFVEGVLSYTVYPADTNRTLFNKQWFQWMVSKRGSSRNVSNWESPAEAVCLHQAYGSSEHHLYQQTRTPALSTTQTATFPTQNVSAQARSSKQAAPKCYRCKIPTKLTGQYTVGQQAENHKLIQSQDIHLIPWVCLHKKCCCNPVSGMQGETANMKRLTTLMRLYR